MSVPFYLAVAIGVGCIASLALILRNAPVTAGEAVAPVQPSGSANPIPAGFLRTFRDTWRARLTAAGRAFHALRGVAEKCRAAIAEEITGEIAQHRRGYVTEPCAICREDVHDYGEMCPRQKSAQCLDCGHVVLLTYYGCPTTPRHKLTNIQATTSAEWNRARFRVLRPTPFTARGKPTAEV